ncbi:MAG: signal recognition particle receptor subunit alpha, partial [Anaerolineales bacterium]
MADILSRWRTGLSKTSKAAFGRLASLFGATEITDETWDELEALLIQADLGIETTTEVIDSLQRLTRTEGLLRSDELGQALRSELRQR